MDNLTLNLVKFGLDMHSVRQTVAASNIAGAELGNTLKVDFSEYLQRLDSMEEKDQLALLQAINSNGDNLKALISEEQGLDVNVEQQHAASTKAMLEYQALVEALNRRLSIKSLVLGAQQ